MSWTGKILDCVHRNRKTLVVWALVLSAELLVAGCVDLFAGCGSVAVTTPAVATTGIVVTNFAVPVAVPQYAVPVANQSYVQYGGNCQSGCNNAPPSPQQNTNTNETAEDRIAAKILSKLVSAGVIKPSALPTIASKACLQCHSGATPKAGLDLSDLSRLDDGTLRQAIARITADDPKQQMPPPGAGVKLSASDLGKLINEFATAQVAPRPAPVDPAPTPTPGPGPAPAPPK